MYPHFSDMKKREKANENHKASLRQKLRRNKEDYIGYGGDGQKEQYDFPKMTDEELEDFRIKLEKERKKENIKTILVMTLSAIFIMIVMKFGNEILAYLIN